MIDPQWVLSLMLKAEPAAATSPWRSTYESTAVAIAEVADAWPLFAGADGVERTAAVLVSVAWFESRFQPDAVGDCTDAQGRGVPCVDAKGAPTPGATPHSFCAFQIGSSNFAALGTTRAEVQGSIRACTLAAAKMMRISFGVCRAEPLERRLDHYAVGGNGCQKPRRDEGAHRIRKAQWLYANVPTAKAKQ